MNDTPITYTLKNDQLSEISLTNFHTFKLGALNLCIDTYLIVFEFKCLLSLLCISRKCNQIFESILM